MRGRYGTADAVEAAKNQVPLIICRPNRLMDKGRNGSRYFRNPPQPHMCIQDFIEDTNEPCFINVLSWIKISTPRKPEDPIPLYGGMRVPHNSSAALSLSNHFGAKGQPVIFAVMANPEILRLSGKTAEDPSDRDALVELMIDFVEAMNPDVRFKRQFTVLRDRDLAGELKDIWLAVQAKRERERGESGKRDSEKGRENKEDTWREEVRHRQSQNVNQEKEKSSIQSQERIQVTSSYHEGTVSKKNESNQRTESPKVVAVEEQYQEAGQNSPQCIYLSPQCTTTLHLPASPSTPEPTETNLQHIRSMNCQEESVYSIIRSHYEQDLNRKTVSNTALPTEQGLPQVLTSTCVRITPKQAEKVCSHFPSCIVNDSPSSFEATSVIQPTDERNILFKSVQHDDIHCTSLRPKDDECSNNSEDKNLFSNECPSSCSTHFSYESISHMKEESESKPSKNSNIIPPKYNSTPAEEHSFSGYTGETVFLNNKCQVPNAAGRSHEDLLPGLCDSPGAKFPVVSDHNTVSIP